MAEFDLKPDLCVVGAGVGGRAVATAAIARGMSVVLIEKGNMNGSGADVLPIRSHALIAAAAMAHAARRAPDFGVRVGQPVVDAAALRAHIEKAVANATPAATRIRLEAMGIRVIQAAGVFQSPKMLAAGEFRINSNRFVVATGSEPLVPRIPGLETIRYLTTETVFDLAEAPSHLLVIGAGPRGLAIAQAWRRLGANVTVIDSSVALAAEDPELAAVALAAVRDEGVRLIENATIRAAEAGGAGARLRVAFGGTEELIEGSHVFVAAGSRPRVEGLGLEAARVAFTSEGVRVNARLRTTNARVFAIGDVTGAPGNCQSALTQADIVLPASRFRSAPRFDASTVPRVVHTDPEIAVVGLDESEARRRHKDIRVLRWPLSETGRARAEQGIKGHVKIIASRRGFVLGAGVVGPRAGEMTGVWALAIANAMNVEDIASLVPPYPSCSEAIQQAARRFSERPG